MQNPRVVVVGDLLYDLLARVEGDVALGTDTFTPIRAERTRVPAAPARAIDTTGAGDALCAGFLAAWLTGAPAGEALRWGVGLASCAIERVGGRPKT